MQTRRMSTLVAVGAGLMLAQGAFAAVAYQYQMSGFEASDGFTPGDLNSPANQPTGWGYLTSAATIGTVVSNTGLGAPAFLQANSLQVTAGTQNFGMVSGIYTQVQTPAGETSTGALTHLWKATLFYRTPDVLPNVGTGTLLEIDPAFGTPTNNRYAWCSIRMDPTLSLWIDDYNLPPPPDPNYWSNVKVADLAASTWYSITYSLNLVDGVIDPLGNDVWNPGTNRWDNMADDLANDLYTVSVNNLITGALVGTASGTTWEVAFLSAGWGTGYPEAITGFSIFSMNSGNAGRTLGYLDIPEPTVLSMLGLGAAFLVFRRRR